jgi:hypothetical protein
MRLNPTRESFGAAITAAGFKYMPQKLIDDLFRNRVDYALLVQRLKAIAEEKQWSELLR